MKVYQRIRDVQAEMAKEGVAKSRKNQQQGYTFRGIEDLQNALAPVLAQHGLVILPRYRDRVVTERQTKLGGVMFHVTIEGAFDFVAVEDASTHTVITYGEAMDSGDKATNKAMSAAYKYAAFQAFCIPTEAMPDADATTPEPVVGVDFATGEDKTVAVVHTPSTDHGTETHEQKIARIKAEAAAKFAQTEQPPPAAPAPPVNPAPKPLPVPPPPPVATTPAPSGSVYITAINVKNGNLVVKDGVSKPAWGPLYVIAFSAKVKASDGALVSDATTFDQKLAGVAEMARDQKLTLIPQVVAGKKKGSYNLQGFLDE